MSQSPFGRLFQMISSLFSRKSSSGVSDTSSSPLPGSPSSSGSTSSLTGRKLAWAGHNNVTREFCLEVIAICKRLGIPNPDWLMGCMAFETGPRLRFKPNARNLAGSSGTGLIMFMATTARALGTTVEALAKMTQAEQLVYVEKYFKPYSGKLKTFEDVYMAILWPAAIGKPLDHVLFRRGSLAYTQNVGLDVNGDGVITKEEASAKAREALNMGYEGAFYAEV